VAPAHQREDDDQNCQGKKIGKKCKVHGASGPWSFYDDLGSANSA